jgi:O-antigen ligase
VLQATILAVTLAWSLNVVSFLDVKEAALWLGVLALAVCGALAGRDIAPGIRAMAACWIVLAGVVAIGAVVAPVPAFVWYEGLRLAPLLLLGSLAYDLLQHPVYRIAILRAISCAALCAAALALFQGGGLLSGFFPRFAHYDQDMYSVFGNEGLLAGFLAVGLICLPGALGMGRTRPSPRWRTALLLLVGGLLAMTILLTESRGALVAALVGMVALLVTRVIPPRAGLVGLLGFLIAGLALDYGTDLDFWSKWRGLFNDTDVGGNLRRWILGASFSLLGDHPVLGCGLGNFAREIPPWLGHQALISARGANTLTTDHAHLDLLEWLCETGLIGALGALWVLSSIRSRFPVALCGLLVLFVFSLTHPAFYSAPHAMIGVVLYSMNLPTRPGPVCGTARARLLSIGVVLLVGAGAVTFIMTAFHPSILLRRAEDVHLAGGDAGADYEEATGAWGYHPDAHESYGIYALGRDDLVLALEQLLRARQGLETGRVYQLLALVATARGDLTAACHWYESCLARWPWAGDIRALHREICAAADGAGSG